jgi:hypothetical protein
VPLMLLMRLLMLFLMLLLLLLLLHCRCVDMFLIFASLSLLMWLCGCIRCCEEGGVQRCNHF